MTNNNEENQIMLNQKMFNQSINQLIKKCSISILITIIFLLAADFLVYCVDYVNIVNYAKKIQVWHPPFEYSLIHTENPYNFTIDTDFFSKAINDKSNKKAVYIFGCSYAYSQYVEENKSFGYTIAKITDRPVYNFSYPGLSLQYMLYQLDNIDFSKYVQPEYLIYVYIPDHIRRIQSDYLAAYELNPYVTYINKNGKLTLKKHFFIDFDSLYIIKKIKCGILQKRIENSKYDKSNEELFKLHIKTINEKLKQKFPNAKFVIFAYNTFNQDKIHWDDIRNEGITVVQTDILTKENLNEELYRRADGHPTEQTWAMLTPLFLKNAKIK